MNYGGGAFALPPIAPDGWPALTGTIPIAVRQLLWVNFCLSSSGDHVGLASRQARRAVKDCLLDGAGSSSRAEKERIVAAALELGAVASEIARTAGIHTSQLFRWRRQLFRIPRHLDLRGFQIGQLKLKLYLSFSISSARC
jgi:hypothetical protein